MIQEINSNFFKTMKIRFKVVLELFKLSVSELLTFGNTAVASINGNSYFSTPHPTLSACSTALADLETAAEAAKNGDGGTEATAIQDMKRLVVQNLLTELGHYVEDTANDPTNVGQEAAVILSAGMKVKKVSPRQKRVFAAKSGKLMGTVDLIAPRALRGTHEWGYTTTPNDPESWFEVTPTTKGATTVTDLTGLTKYYFRHRAVLPSGITDWDEPVAAVAL
jgi:hypothetical protein